MEVGKLNEAISLLKRAEEGVRMVAALQQEEGQTITLHFGDRNARTALFPSGQPICGRVLEAVVTAHVDDAASAAEELARIGVYDAPSTVREWLRKAREAQS